MALADYRLCDVCDGKALYDANLNYVFDSRDEKIPDEERVRISGEEQRFGYRLDYLGDWAVLCDDCSKTHKTAIVPLED